MESTIDLPALRAYAQVVRTGSFTAAAQALDTHKAHLSRVISTLERQLGARLLERTTRSLAVTEVGREFHERALAILASVEEARESVRNSQGAPTGTLRLTCGVEFGMLAVSDWIAAYLREYPRMKVDAEITPRMVDLVHEGFDLAIRVGPLPDSSLVARRLGDLRYGLYASASYLKRAGTPREPEDLAQHALLAFTVTAKKASWSLHRGQEQRRVAVDPLLRATNTFMVRGAAEAGLGIALLPDRMATPLIAQRRLRRVLPDWAPPQVPVHAVFASARMMSPKLRAFVDLAAARWTPR